MIYIERKIIIKNNEATIEQPIVLYKGDRNIELQFTIENNPFKYKPGMDITYGQLIIETPNAGPIFSEPAKMSSSRVLFIVTEEMIDGLDPEGNPVDETGAYNFQIRLLNTDQTSRGTLPKVTGGIVIKQPLYEEAVVNTASVNSRSAVVMRANDGIMLLADEPEGSFDADGNYNRTNWYGGDIITDSKLNKIEEALYQINDDIPTDYATQEYVDDSIVRTRNYIADNYATTSYVNDQRRATEAYAESYTDNAIGRLGLNDCATESFVTDSINSNNNYIETVVLKDYVTDQELEDAINGIEGGGGNVNLDGYATEAYVDDKVAAHAQDVKGAGYAFQSYVDENFATTKYVDKAVANMEVSGGGLNIMTIGNGIDEYIFTGNEFTYEEYTSYAGKSVLLDNVTINFVDAEWGKQRTVTYKNELVYVSFDGDKLFTIVSSLSERECERSQYEIGIDGVITRTYYEQYVTKSYIDEQNFATSQSVGETLGKYATQSYVNEQIGDINAILDAINGEEV